MTKEEKRIADELEEKAKATKSAFVKEALLKHAELIRTGKISKKTKPAENAD